MYFSESLLLVTHPAQFPVRLFLVFQQSGVFGAQPGNLPKMHRRRYAVRRIVSLPTMS